jgi:hypothetical protein
VFITADQIVLHAIGDYVLQSDYMATEKTKRWLPALAHAVVYTLPFLFLTRSPLALLVIAATHFVIDRWRLARYVCWAKNFMAPKWIETTCTCTPPLEGCSDCGKTWKVRNHPWSVCSGTGSHPERPAWLTVWLMILTDNVLHLLCNGAALKWL